MKKISSFALCALLMSCSFSKNEKTSVSNVPAGESAETVKQEAGFSAELTYPGSKIFFSGEYSGRQSYDSAFRPERIQ